MGDLKASLAAGEKVVACDRPHWIVFGVPGCMACFGFVLLAVAAQFHTMLYWLSLGLIGLAAVRFGLVALHRSSTEYAVTKKRVVLKTGFIERRIADFSTAQVESVQVRQTVLGRFLGFGDVRLNGSGGKAVVFSQVPHPIRFRAAILTAQMPQTEARAAESMEP